MQSQNRFFEDLARVGQGAMGVAAGLREEIEARVREQVERMAERLDLVPREDFEAVKEMAQKARAGEEELSERLAALEARIAALEAAPAKTTSRKSAKKSDD